MMARGSISGSGGNAPQAAEMQRRKSQQQETDMAKLGHAMKESERMKERASREARTSQLPYER